MPNLRAASAAAALLLGAHACGGGVPPRESGTTAGGLYWESGGSGPPIVLLHGFSLDRRMWEGQLEMLEPRFQVIRYDLRGHGSSPQAEQAFSHHDDLLEVFESLDLETAVLVGLSLGAETAIDFTLAYPTRVSGLVLAAPGLGGYAPRGSFDWMGPVMTALQAGDPQAATRAWVETPIMRIASDPAADSVMREIVLDNWRVWTGDPSLRARLDPPAIGRLSELAVPTLVLVGEADLIDTQAVADTLATCIGGAQLVAVPETGHLINLEAGEAFNEAVVRFLRTLPRSVSTSETPTPQC